ncbi:MAG: hypothetical protein AB8G86_01710 [Saprospiraceae bacterium]
MKELLKDLDIWWDAFDAKDEIAQLVFLEETIKHELPENFGKASGFGDALLQVIGNIYEKQRAYERIVTFLENLQVQQPQLFKKECPYVGNYVLNYHFYQGNKEAVQPVLDYWIENKDADIDNLLQHFKRLFARGMNQDAIALAKVVYSSIKDNNDKYLGNPETEFSSAIFSDSLQHYYEESVQSKNNLKLSELKTEMKAYDYDFLDGFDEKIINGFDDNYEHPEKSRHFNNKDKTYTLELQLAFQKYMHQLGFHFHLSELIWLEWQNYWWKNLKKEGNADQFFSVDYDNLDRFLGSMKTFFSPRKYDIIQTLWGGNFIFDFLKDKSIISEAVYTQALSIIEKTKLSCHSGFIHTLWELSFLHRIWPKPTSINDLYFTAEAKLFEHTFQSTDNYQQLTRKYPELFEDLPIFVAPPVKKQKSTYPKSDFFDDLLNDKLAPNRKKSKTVAKRRKKNKQAKKSRKRRKK